jgi:excisionase family DNA binding protein
LGEIPFSVKEGYMEKKYLWVKELAEMLGAKPATVYDWIKRGDLPAFKLGRRWVIPVDVLNQKAYSTQPVKPPSPPTIQQSVSNEKKEEKK